MKIGIIGAGHIGGNLAQLLVRNGHQVVVANSRGPETLGDVAQRTGATPVAVADAPRDAEVVIIAVPLKAVADLPEGLLDSAAPGVVVIDTNNYYPQRDGEYPELEAETTTVSELLQRHLPTSHVVKAFNHIYFEDLASQGQPAGTAGRRALAIAGDDADAKKAVGALIDEFGYDVVDVGPLAEGWRHQRDTPAYGPRLDAEELRARLAQAKRYAEMS